MSKLRCPAGPELISPRLYRTFALPYEKQAAECAHGEGLPYALHICGNTNLILGDMTTSGADALELDYKTDMRMARTKMEGRVTFIGNLDPNGVLALGSPQLVEAKTLELLDCFQGSPRFILNAGCAIPPTTPSENIAVPYGKGAVRKATAAVKNFSALGCSLNELSVAAVFGTVDPR